MSDFFFHYRREYFIDACIFSIFFFIFSHDKIKIFDGPTGAFPIIATYCGNSIPPPLISSKNEIYMKFETSGFDSHGFKIQYGPISKYFLVLTTSYNIKNSSSFIFKIVILF